MQRHDRGKIAEIPPRASEFGDKFKTRRNSELGTIYRLRAIDLHETTQNRAHEDGCSTQNHVLYLTMGDVSFSTKRQCQHVKPLTVLPPFLNR